MVGRRRILSTAVLEDLRDLVRSSPSIYLDEIVSWLAVRHGQHVSISTIHRSLVSLGITYKKLRRTAVQRDDITRAQWLADITSRFTAQQLVFADESSKDNRTTSRHYGRAPAGERACEVQSFNRSIRYSILPALSVDGILTVRVVRGSVDSVEFYDWVLKDLVSSSYACRGSLLTLHLPVSQLPKMNPFPGPNSVLIIDNCRTHKSTAVREAVEAAGACLICHRDVGGD